MKKIFLYNVAILFLASFILYLFSVSPDTYNNEDPGIGTYGFCLFITAVFHGLSLLVLWLLNRIVGNRERALIFFRLSMLFFWGCVLFLDAMLILFPNPMMAFSGLIFILPGTLSIILLFTTYPLFKALNRG